MKLIFLLALKLLANVIVTAVADYPLKIISIAMVDGDANDDILYLVMGNALTTPGGDLKSSNIDCHTSLSLLFYTNFQSRDLQFLSA